jgi:hypothetical protein
MAEPDIIQSPNVQNTFHIWTNDYFEHFETGQRKDIKRQRKLKKNALM